MKRREFITLLGGAAGVAAGSTGAAGGARSAHNRRQYFDRDRSGSTASHRRLRGCLPRSRLEEGKQSAHRLPSGDGTRETQVHAASYGKSFKAGPK